MAGTDLCCSAFLVRSPDRYRLTGDDGVVRFFDLDARLSVRNCVVEEHVLAGSAVKRNIGGVGAPVGEQTVYRECRASRDVEKAARNVTSGRTCAYFACLRSEGPRFHTFRCRPTRPVLQGKSQKSAMIYHEFRVAFTHTLNTGRTRYRTPCCSPLQG